MKSSWKDLREHWKNRPKLEDFLEPETLEEAEQEIAECIEWFERGEELNKAFEKQLREFYKGDDFSAHILIQHILCKSGEEILEE